jgi:peptide/nickel transport system ATP-binding protein
MGILPRAAHISGGQILFFDSVPAERSTMYTDPFLVNGGHDEGPRPVDIAALKPDSVHMRAIRGDRISMIFQEPMSSLSPLHTIGNQIIEAVRLHRPVTQGEARAIAAEMLAMVGFADPRKALVTYPFELSGGLRQRAMIAMALVCHPALLIADEPTTALDVTIQAQILKLVKELQSQLEMAMLLITHDLGVVANMADQVVVLYHGKVMERGKVHAVYSNPRHPYLRALMHAVPRVGLPPGERLTPIRDVSHTTGGHFVQGPQWPEGADSAGPLLRVRGLSKRFQIRNSGWFGVGQGAAIAAVERVSFDIARGECLGLVGESGCGKTTLSKLILCVVDPDEGEIYFNNRGRRLSLLDLGAKELADIRCKIQYVFQDPFGSLNPRMTVFDIISEPLVIHRIADRSARAEIVQELMRLTGLDPRFLARYPHSFSGGQRQRIGIARALALNPELLICDEPVSALDVSVQAQILNLLKDLQSELGLTYLFISHNLAVVDYMADRIAVMCAGRLVEVAPRECLFREPRHPYTRALLAAVPRTDPNQPLDFQALMDGKASDPAAWPAPFDHDDSDPAALVDLGGGHWVRARTSGRTRISKP